jgi:CRISPR-associated protein Cmr4
MPSLLFVHALSPLHAGTGHAVGAVDLPIARDKATGFPYLPGSSIKGVLRDTARKVPGFDEVGVLGVLGVFGPERDKAHDHAGALLVGDASLLLLPVRSVVGTFAWATSPWLLQRLARDARECGGPVPAVPSVPSIDHALVSREPSIIGGKRVVFEDLDFEAEKSEAVDKLAAWIGERLFPKDKPDAEAWQALLKKKLCVLHDDSMAFFSEHGTDVVTRIAIDADRKTVKEGALWTEESLPSESVLVALIAGQATSQVADAAMAVDRIRPLLERNLQLGGDATTGRGRCRLVLAGGVR